MKDPDMCILMLPVPTEDRKVDTVELEDRFVEVVSTLESGRTTWHQLRA